MAFTRLQHIGLIAAVGLAVWCGIDSPPAAAQNGSPESMAARRSLGAAGEVVIPHMNLKEVELATVLRAIAQFAGINVIVAGDGLQGRTVSVFWEGVTVQAALDKLLQAQGYGYIFQDNIVTVLPLDKIGEGGVQTETVVIPLQYVDAAKAGAAMSDLVTDGVGDVKHVEGSNSIIVRSTSKEVEDIRRVLAEIDKRLPQILIDAKLVEMTVEMRHQFGLDFTYFNLNDPQNRFDQNLSNATLFNPQQAAQFTFGIIKNSHFFEGFIQADASSGDISVLANPQILALDNSEARIEIIDRLPYIETNVSQGVITESVSYQDAGIFLRVLPHVTEDGMIRMHVNPKQSIAGPLVQMQNSTAFPINVRETETDLIVPDGQTIVIGGLRSEQDTVSFKKIPFMGDIPILGMFFRNKLREKSGTDLLVFITPTIVQETLPLSEREEQHLKSFDELDLIKRRDEQKKKWWRPWDRIGISS